METPKIFESEYRFCLILWEEEPVTTTYTVIKRLGERGVVKNEDGLVTALISREEAQVSEIDELVEKKFQGSLPAFLAAFARRQELSEEEVEEIRRIIEK